MSIRKIKNSWWIDFRFNRTRIRKRSPANSKEGAKDFEAFSRQRLARGESLDDRNEKGEIAYKDFVKEWFDVYVKNNNKHSEIITKESVLRVHLRPFFGSIKLKRIDSLKIEEFKREKIQSGLNSKTINNLLAILKKSLNTAVEWQYISSAPKIKLLTVAPQSHDYLSEYECGLLLNNTPAKIKEMVLVALRTGLRFGEIIALTWPDINFDSKMILVSKSISKGVLGSTKTNRNRPIPLYDDLWQVLFPIRQKSGYIFTNKDGSPMKQVACCKLLHRACRQAKIRRIGWHKLRHTFASHLAQKNVSIQIIQELLGHTNVRTTMRYAHLGTSELRSAIQCLGSFGQPVGLNSIPKLNYFGEKTPR